MLYVANASSPRVRDAMAAGELAMMVTPREGRPPAAARWWAADNGCGPGRGGRPGTGYPGDPAWLRWLARHTAHADRCLFAAAPDVVAAAAATLARSAPHLPAIRRLGYPAALVAQDGLEHLTVPWREFDVLFLGGSTAWKLGPAARQLAAEAKHRGKWVHVGRVNTRKRWRYARYIIQADSCDGTMMAIAPDINLALLRAWEKQIPLYVDAQDQP